MKPITQEGESAFCKKNIRNGRTLLTIDPDTFKAVSGQWAEDDEGSRVGPGYCAGSLGGPERISVFIGSVHERTVDHR